MKKSSAPFSVPNDFGLSFLGGSRSFFYAHGTILILCLRDRCDSSAVLMRGVSRFIAAPVYKGGIKGVQRESLAQRTFDRRLAALSKVPLRYFRRK